MKKILLAAPVFPLTVVLFFWIRGSGELLVSGDLPLTLLAIARLMGLLGVLSVLLQLLLIGRIKWIERLWGHDKLAYVHHKNGRYLITFLLIHFSLILTSYSLLGKVGPLTQLKKLLFEYPDVWKAFTALILFSIVAITSIFLSRLKLKYEIWYFVHLMVYAAILLAYGHQMQNGGDFSQTLFSSFWIALYVFVISNFIFFRLFRPLYFFWKHSFFVDRLVPETHEVTSIYISGQRLEEFHREGGQFIIVRFFDWKRFWQAHPFSLSQSKNHDELRISVKNSGDYTSEISSLKPKTRVLIDGPHGVFTVKSAERKKILCIVGGIGITPIRALIEESNGAKDIILLYSNKQERDIAFKRELDGFAKKYPLRIEYFLTEEKGVTGWAKMGRIDQSVIQTLVPDLGEREVFLCGPTPFMDAMKEALSQLQVETELIHFEKFSLH